MPDLSPISLLTTGIAAFLTGLSKSGIAGANIIALPFMAAALGAKASVGIMLPILITGDLLALLFFRRHVRWPVLLRLLPFTMAGIAAGYPLMGRITDAELRTVIGVLIIGLVALRYLLRAFHIEQASPGVRFAPAVGILAGVATILANAAGSLVTIYLLWMKVKKEQFIGTAAWFFFIVNVTKVPLLVSLKLITPRTLGLDGMMVPLVCAGAVTGVFIVRRVPQRLFEVLIMTLALAGALKLLM